MRGMSARFLAFLAVCLGLSLQALGAGQTLYAVSLRSGGATAQPSDVRSNLYTINLATGSAQLVGSLRLDGKPVGVTGLASHPTTGVMYAITAETSPYHPNALITVDPKTALCTFVADIGVSVSDLAFDSKGVMWAWLPASTRVGTVDLSNGNVTPLGKGGPPGAPAGIAIDPNDMIFVTAKGAGGSLDNIDMATGNLQIGPPLTGAPFATIITSLSFSPSGLLLGVNSNGGSPAETRLVTINAATGAIATIGALPDDTDALAFSSSMGPNIAPTFSTLNPGARVVVAAISTVLVVLAIFVLVRGRRRR